MKFLADVNVERSIVEEIGEMGHDIKWVAEIDRYMDDLSIFKLAQKEDRVLLTNDKDFGEIVFRQKLIAAGVVLFRIKGQDVGEKMKMLKALLSLHGGKVEGHFVVITNERFRFIPLEPQGG